LPLKISARNSRQNPREPNPAKIRPELSPEKLREEAKKYLYISLGVTGSVLISGILIYLFLGQNILFLLASIGAEIPVALVSTYLVIDRIVRAYTLKLKQLYEALPKTPAKETIIQQPQAPLQAAPLVQPSPVVVRPPPTTPQRKYEAPLVEQPLIGQPRRAPMQPVRQEPVQVVVPVEPKQEQILEAGQDSIKRCPHCGRELPYGDLHIICPYCGKYLR
jgi:hypothetical protein